MCKTWYVRVFIYINTYKLYCLFSLKFYCILNWNAFLYRLFSQHVKQLMDWGKLASKHMWWYVLLHQISDSFSVFPRIMYPKYWGKGKAGFLDPLCKEKKTHTFLITLYLYYWDCELNESNKCNNVYQRKWKYYFCLRFSLS